jgi:hypothetical protein
MATTPTPTRESVELITEHYQKTYELTHELRKDRNRIFLILVGFLAIATLLFSLGQPQANSLLVKGIAKALDLTDKNEIAALQNNANFSLLQTMVLAVVFYLAVNLYHHTTTVLRLYSYLGKMESEIRDALILAPSTVSFTRESIFYNKYHSRWLGWVGRIYVLILLVLLGSFLYLRLADDWHTGFNWFTFTDVAISLAIAAYFYAYSTASAKS